MSLVEASPERRLVLARLGREPQDALEAAVVLEAWGGLRAPEALAAGSEVVAHGSPEPVRSQAPASPRVGPGAHGRQELVLVGAIVVLAAWAVPLGRAVGPGGVVDALRLALPLTLALQWGLARRWLQRADGLARVRWRLRELCQLALAAAVVATVALGTPGALAMMLTVIWVGGMVVVERGWALPYLGVLLAATAVMGVGLAPVAVAAGAAVAVALLTLAALPPIEAAPSGAMPPRTRAVGAAVLGAGIGILLVVDPVSSSDAFAALGLLPACAASAWAGRRLWHTHHALRESLRGQSAIGSLGGRARTTGLRVVVAACLRLWLLAAAGSVVLAALAASAGSPIDASALASYALVAQLGLLASLLEAMGEVAIALLAVATGLVAAGGLAALPAAEPGLGALVGAGTADVVALVGVVVLLLRPAGTMATRVLVR